jgi:acyl transferase domain-containing protein
LDLLQALHDSGIDYRGSKTGVYFAQLLTSTNELDDDRYEINSYNGGSLLPLFLPHKPLTHFSQTVGKCIAIRANRVSFTFDLRGPSLTVDTGSFCSPPSPISILMLDCTACSSSGTAMHLALCAVKLGEVDQALVLGKLDIS